MRIRGNGREYYHLYHDKSPSPYAKYYQSYVDHRPSRRRWHFCTEVP